MVKVFKLNSPLALFLGFGLLVAFVFIGLPLLLLAIALFTLLSIFRSFWGIKTKRSQNYTFSQSAPQDPYVSPVIHNKKIGDYRVIENPNDPSVIEVEKL